MRCAFKGTSTTPHEEKAHSAKTNASIFGRGYSSWSIYSILGPYAIYNLVGNHIQLCVFGTEEGW